MRTTECFIRKGADINMQDNDGVMLLNNSTCSFRNCFHYWKKKTTKKRSSRTFCGKNICTYKILQKKTLPSWKKSCLQQKCVSNIWICYRRRRHTRHTVPIIKLYTTCIILLIWVSHSQYINKSCVHPSCNSP